MPGRFSSIATAIACAAALAGCGFKSQPNPFQIDECGDMKILAEDIVNGVGEPDPEVVTLTGGQILSIGAINIDWSGMCTGTLVAPNVVLTAAHCIPDEGSSVRFLVGDSYLPPEASFNGVEWHAHPMYDPDALEPAYDVGVVIISGDTEARGLEPILVNGDELSLLGETIQAVGYGATDPTGGMNTERWWTTQKVVIERPGSYEVNDGGESGLCSGDSGGPMLYTIPGSGLRITGVASSVDDIETCLGNSFYARTDTVAEWLSEWIPMTPCGYETAVGRCDGEVAVWCEDDAILYHDCASFDWDCGPNDDGDYRCVEPCGDETARGRCDGNVAVWCEGGDVLYHDCPSFGYECGLNAAGNYRCVTPDPCHGIGLSGTCDGDVAMWCEGGGLWYHYCADFGRVCGVDDDGRSRCLDECGLLGFAGECEGDVARWCEGGRIRERDCGACGSSCGDTGGDLGFYCM